MIVKGEGKGAASSYATLLLQLLACDESSTSALFLEATLLHHEIVCKGLSHNTLLLNLLIRIYGSCGSPSTSLSLFSQLPNPNQHSWNFIISALSEYHPNTSFQLFQDMENRACLLPNKFIYASILSACAFKNNPQLGSGSAHSPYLGQIQPRIGSTLPLVKCLHVRVCALGLDEDVAVGTALVNTYAKHAHIEDACFTFGQILCPNTHSWTAIISAIANHGDAEEAVCMLARMHEQGLIPNKVSFLSSLHVCDNEMSLIYAKPVHVAILENGFESDRSIATSLINMYAKCGKLNEARAIFGGISRLDEQAWNAMISAHVLYGQAQEVIYLYSQMLLQGLLPNNFIIASILSACANPTYLCEGKRIHAFVIGSKFEYDPVVRNTLVNMYGKCGDLELALFLFEESRDPDKFLWTSMIVLLCEYGEGQDALQCFARMQGHVKPDKVMFSSILSACANEAMLNQGKGIHSYIIEEGVKVDLAVGNALLNMYSKCGNLRDAENVFVHMGCKDTVSWNAMISAYSHHGDSKASIALFNAMKETSVCPPNEVTFVIILSACSHAGMVEEGSGYFMSMTQDHGIEPFEEHYNCMIDLFGRAGQLEDAEDLIAKMPMEASVVSWMTLLSACKCEMDLSRGIKYANKLFQLEPDSSAPYFMLADLYYRVGMEEEATKILHTLNAKGIDQVSLEW